MNFRFLLIFTALLPFSVSGQNQRDIDSLQHLLKTQEGEERFKTLHGITVEYLFNDTKLALPYIKQEELLAKQLNDSSLIAEAANVYGVFFNLNSEYRKAIENIIQPKRYFVHKTIMTD